MKIGNVMSRDVQLIKPDDTIRSAAALMKKIDAGLLPVTENDKLVGMITDRDIAIRGVAEGKGPDAKVRDAMSPEVKYCFEDEDVAHVAENMAELQVKASASHEPRQAPRRSRSRILQSKVHCRKQQRRFTAFRNRAANTTRVSRVINNHMVLGTAASHLE
jgi:CBS domain-containing protein